MNLVFIVLQRKIYKCTATNSFTFIVNTWISMFNMFKTPSFTKMVVDSENASHTTIDIIQLSSQYITMNLLVIMWAPACAVILYSCLSHLGYYHIAVYQISIKFIYFRVITQKLKILFLAHEMGHDWPILPKLKPRLCYIVTCI